MASIDMPSGNSPRRIITRRRTRGLSAAEIREFNLVVGGFAFFQALVAGTKLDIFSRLARRPGRTLAEIGVELHTTPYATRILLFGLCAAGLLLRDRSGRYRNSRTANALLVRKSPENVLAAIAAYDALIYRPFFHLTEAVRMSSNVGLKEYPGKGRTLYARLAKRPADERIFQDWLHLVSSHGNQVLTSLPIMSRVKHLLDVGGGDGTNALSLRKAIPGIKVTVFDLPSVCRLAEQNIRRAGARDAISTAPGDFLVDPFPPAVDGVLFGHLLNIFSPERNRNLLRRAYEAVPRNGVVICFNSMADDDETGPPRSALLSLYFLTLASGEGMVYPWKDYRRWFREAGFRRITVHRLNDLMDHGIIVGVK